MDDGVYDAAVDAVTAGRHDVQECSTNNVPLSPTASCPGNIRQSPPAAKYWMEFSGDKYEGLMNEAQATYAMCAKSMRAAKIAGAFKTAHF